MNEMKGSFSNLRVLPVGINVPGSGSYLGCFGTSFHVLFKRVRVSKRKLNVLGQQSQYIALFTMRKVL